MTLENKKRITKNKWQKENIKIIAIHFNKEKDKEILEWLDQQPCKINTIRIAIKKYIQRG